MVVRLTSIVLVTITGGIIMRSYYNCESGGRFVTVWPCVTGESGFYDVVYGDIGDSRHPSDNVYVERLTVTEAAAYVLTELGTPVATTIDSLAGMISRWRAEFDASGSDYEGVRS